MVKSKVITPKLALAHRSDANLAEYCLQRINSLTENAAAFANMSPTLATLVEHYNDYITAMESCGRSGNPATTAAKNKMRETLCFTLTHCAQSCSEIAGDNIPLFELSGFQAKGKGTRLTSISTPAKISISQGPLDGTVYCSFDIVAGARCYEIHFGTTPENIENWDCMYTSSTRKNLVADLPSLSRCYLRIRAIGVRGMVSGWSSVVEFKVL
jgi:hypothetical protein